jgi:hypothetical protein
MLGILTLANLVACFLEGGLGFGGSLTFLALTVPFLGWSEGLFADCVFAGVNLTFVTFLDRRHLDLRLVGRSWLRALPLVIVGTLAFVLLPNALRSLPVLVMGILILWRLVPVPDGLLAPAAGLGVGLGNTEEPFGFLLFQDRAPPSIANTAAFAAGLLATKALALLVLAPPTAVPTPLTWASGITIGAVAAYAGRHTLGRLPQAQRHSLTRILVPLAALGLALGLLLSRR